jgi:hypothetical protein
VQRLLVLEDEPGIGKVVSRALSLARFQIDGAAYGRSGSRWPAAATTTWCWSTSCGQALDGVGSAGLTVKVGRADAAEDFHADGEGHERVDRGPGHHQADRQVARS